MSLCKPSIRCIHCTMITSVVLSYSGSLCVCLDNAWPGSRDLFWFGGMILLFQSADIDHKIICAMKPVHNFLWYKNHICKRKNVLIISEVVSFSFNIAHAILIMNRKYVLFWLIFPDINVIYVWIFIFGDILVKIVMDISILPFHQL